MKNPHAVESSENQMDEAPGDAGDTRISFLKYSAGLTLSIVLTLTAFWASTTPAIWSDSRQILLAALAIGQMGVHLIFFLHISSGPEGANTILALAFGIFVVAFVVFGSLIIMSSLENAMLPAT
ncbi:MAG: cytochrome o ubiquinol oxidase subunit IV [Pseudomonas sp.]|uniref:cytochrome o ubiquinol oxidase subunit IV n=1 Tax=Pseudomonas sp. TaxID=306 RepID=UPI0011F64078|nr:cytochrome C oxidase subunit IV family protein [Pseudomonas sp.]RZI68205.1 MAG: cytochrome o ubiquinol oxidase subunit IV [Pseudomonas sp.]